MFGFQIFNKRACFCQKNSKKKKKKYQIQTLGLGFEMGSDSDSVAYLMSNKDL